MLFAAALSTGSIAVLAHGFLGAGRFFTALLMLASLAGLMMSGNGRDLGWNRSDLYFLFLTCCATLSLFIAPAEPKEVALMVLSLAAYPAGRAVAAGPVLPGFILTSAGIVALGVSVTLPALIEQWDWGHGKPLVFGKYNDAGTQFAALMGFALIASICTKLDWRRTALISALLSVPSMVFAASVVRFTFLALAATLAASILLGPAQRRKYVTVILGALILSAIAGAATRSKTTLEFLKLAASTMSPPAHAATGDDCPGVDRKNSLSIRKQLYLDAFAMLPEAGMLGLGLDSFMEQSCPLGHQVHNTVLQTIIEFGWPAGAALVALIIAGLRYKGQTARFDAEAHFAFCGLLFALLLGMVHGRISREVPLFLFLGYTATIQTRRSPKAIHG